MKKVTSFIEDHIAPPLIRFANFRYIQVSAKRLGYHEFTYHGSMFYWLLLFHSTYLDF